MRRISDGSAYRRPDSDSWYIQFSIDGELKRESAGTTSREEAIEFLRRRLDEARNGRYTDVDRRPTFSDLERLLLQRDAALRDPSDVEQIVEQPAEVVGLAAQHPDWHGGFRIAGITQRQHLACVANRRKGVAQFVSEHRQELVLLAVGDAQRVAVEVCNEGAIPAEVLPRVFEPFRSGRHHGRRGEGLGLGLFIAKAIAVAHGGGLEVDSSAGATTFRLVLPRKSSLA